MKLVTNNRVSIFNTDRIRIDWNLPKHQNKYMNSTNDGGVILTPSNRSTTNGVIDMEAALLFENTTVGFDFYDEGAYISLKDLDSKKSWWDKFIYFFNAVRMYKDSKSFAERQKQKIKEKEEKAAEQKKKEEEAESTKMSAREFFSNIKVTLSASEKQQYEEKIAQYLKEMTKAKKLGQTAMYEQMSAAVEIMRMDALLQIKEIKHISEEDIVKLEKNSKRGLCIDYIENFARIIPDEVLEAKEKADEMHIFDNYVVVHYDPNDTGSKKTEKEIKEEKKDPILFGIIAGSTNLYFVADWIDEYCDLTFDKAIEIIHKED